MNASAKAHLAKAKEYVDRGEQFHHMAAEQMRAAKDAGATWVEIGDLLGRSESWVHAIIKWHESPANGLPALESPFAGDSPRRQRDAAKQALRERPEIVTDLSPDEQRAVARKLDEASAIRQKDREKIAKAKEREHLGDETVDDLEHREELQSTEYLLISARSNLRGFVKRTGEIGIDNTPPGWRESCLDWIEDLKGHLGMAEALLAGDSIDWSAFEDMLEKEGA